jgi:hypothetical protein
MFKSVSFNIFDENLEDIVYRDEFDVPKESDNQPDKAVERTIRKTTEVIIKPLNERRFDCYRKANETV